jgi:hypothetical protein
MKRKITGGDGDIPQPDQALQRRAAPKVLISECRKILAFL